MNFATEVALSFRTSFSPAADDVLPCVKMHAHGAQPSESAVRSSARRPRQITFMNPLSREPARR